MNKWEDLKQEIRRKRAVETRISVPKPSVHTLGLFVLAITLGIIIIAMSRVNHEQQPSGSGVNLKVDVPLAQQQDGKQDIKVSLPPTATDTDELKRQVGIMDKKLMLLGSAHNNNWHILQNRLPANDLVYFGYDWKLNQFPSHIQIANERDRAIMSDWVQQ